MQCETSVLRYIMLRYVTSYFSKSGHLTKISDPRSYDLESSKLERY